METKNANDAYREKRARVDRHLKQIQDLLREHAEKQAALPGNWGFPGDLGHVDETLAELVCFLGGGR